MVDWVVWYQDGSMVDSNTHRPEDIPRDGVQAVVIKDKAHGRLIWSRADGYAWQNGTWVPHMRDGLDQYGRMNYKPKVVIRGFGIPDEEFWVIYHKVVADADKRLPARTDLVPDDTPLPSRYRQWCFLDFDETSDADVIEFSRTARTQKRHTSKNAK